MLRAKSNGEELKGEERAKSEKRGNQWLSGCTLSKARCWRRNTMIASHMNSRMYVSRFDQATWFLLHAIGVTPASIKQQNQRIAIVRQNYQFLEELRGGELVEIKSGFLAVGEKYFRFIHQMYDYETGKMVATCDSVAVQASLESGKSIPLTSSLQEKAKRYLVTSNVPLDSQVG